jgi:hypothetical protein
MLSYNSVGELIISGFYTYVDNLYSIFGKDQIVKDVINGTLVLEGLERESTIIDRLLKLESRGARVKSELLEKYIEIKRSDINSINLDAIMQYIKTINSKIEMLTEVIIELTKQNHKLHQQMDKDAFLTLEQVAEKLMMEGELLYTVGSLRNMIKKEEIAPNMTVGYLDIGSFHLVLMKRGKKWITPAAHFIEERSKINYDLTREIKNRRKKKTGKQKINNA